MATYYALFAEQLSRPVVSVPYVDAFGTGKTREIIMIKIGSSITGGETRAL